MTKQEFLSKLGSGLTGLTEADAQERLTFYSEMIDDRMEEGLSEEDAVAQIGDVETIVASILAEIPQRAPEKALATLEAPEQKTEAPKKQSKKGLETWQIVMLILGAPLWVPLLATAFSLVITLIAVIWSVIGILWGALFVSLAACGIALTLNGLGCMIAGQWVVGAALLGAGLACAGLAVFVFFGCIYATKGAAWLTKMTFVGITKLFRGKER
ncbi:MAG: DUF1700 domain-containing protein [Clostridia bacterium]|nr:DUF1700 domain-containing protein [Clostridia bacterium]